MVDSTFAQSDLGGVAVNEQGHWKTFTQSGSLFRLAQAD